MTRRASRQGNGNNERADVYTRITSRIVQDLEKGVRTWMQPWSTEHAAGRITRPLRANGQAYRGINIVMLWASAIEQGFAAPIWMTYRQAQELGGQVVKGAQGSLVVYADRIRRIERNESTGEDESREIPFMKGYTVFNVEQIEGLPGHLYGKAEPVAAGQGPERIEAAEAFFRALGADIRHGGNRAYYAHGSDHVQMPPFESFEEAQGYYAVLAHECVHWTKHESRLDRDLGRKRWGDEGYAREELVAELGSAFLACDLGIALEPREDHAAYIASWLKVLKDDKRAIFGAASLAQAAVDYLHGRQDRDEGQGEDGEAMMAA